MSKQISSGGISGLEVLLIVFIVLKLTDVIAWSWWWVMAPLWIPLVIALCIAVIWLFYQAMKYVRS